MLQNHSIIGFPSMVFLLVLQSVLYEFPPLRKQGEITYSDIEVDDVAKSILPLNRLEVRKGEKAIPERYH